MNWWRAIVVMTGLLLCTMTISCRAGSNSPKSTPPSTPGTPAPSVQPGLIGMLTAAVSTPGSNPTAQTPPADLERGIVAILTAGVPTGTALNAQFVGSVLSAGGISVDDMTAQTLTDDQLHSGIESLATGQSDGSTFTVSVYTTPEGSDAARHDASHPTIRCGRILVEFDGEGDATSTLAARALLVMEQRYGACDS